MPHHDHVNPGYHTIEFVFEDDDLTTGSGEGGVLTFEGDECRLIALLDEQLGDGGSDPDPAESRLPHWIVKDGIDRLDQRGTPNRARQRDDGSPSRRINDVGEYASTVEVRAGTAKAHFMI